VIFFHCDTKYNTDQTAVGTVHIDNHLDSFGAAVVSRWCQGEWGGVECKLFIVIIIEFWDFTY